MPYFQGEWSRTRGGGEGYSPSVEWLFSITPLPDRFQPLKAAKQGPVDPRSRVTLRHLTQYIRVDMWEGRFCVYEEAPGLYRGRV
jgi:hypothetical protein